MFIIKKDEDLENKEMKMFLIEQIVGLSLFNALFYIEVQKSFNIAVTKQILFVIWIVLGVLCLIFALTNKFIVVAYNFYRMLFINISVFIIYLGSAGFLDLKSNLVKIFLMCNFILIELILLIRRVFKTNKMYINKLQKDKHEKYLYADWRMAALMVGMGNILAMIAEYKFTGNVSKDPLNILAALIGMVISALAVVICVHGYGKYMYVIRLKIKR
ncbi:hypothetical protein [Clostridium sp. JNZ J1-5]